MTTSDIDSVATVALWIVARASLLLGLAAVLHLALRRRLSAAARHFGWTIVVASLLLLPLASIAMPEWTVVVRTESIPMPTAAPIVNAGEPAIATPALVHAATFPLDAPRGPISWQTALVALYGTGALAIVVGLVVLQWNARRFARTAVPVDDPAWLTLLDECARRIGVHRPVRLLRSRSRSVPAAYGLRQPSIVIPAIADTWSEDRRQAVLLHELAHVARHDCLTQTLAVGVCAMYWFHPGAWWLARRLRVERELACDDAVIASGAQPREYAGHLLEIAYSLGPYRAPALAVSMAKPSQLEGRLIAALDAARDRRVPPMRRRAVAAAIGVGLVCVVASAKPTTATAPIDRPQASTDRALPDWKPVAQRVARAATTAIGLQDSASGTWGSGTWEIRPAEKQGFVHVRVAEGDSSYGTDMPIDQLQGVTGVQLTGAGGPVQFKIRRDAGTFSFDGVLRNGIGAGTFSFTADPNFPAELAKRGFARPTAKEQYQLARGDIGYAFLDELNRQQYAKPQTSELVRAGQHGVQTTYLREMGAIGYKLGSLEPLIVLRDHGVTPDYVRGLADQGYKGIDADTLRKARDHGVTPDYVKGMRDAGYNSVPLDELITLRDHGITPDYVQGLGEAGYRKLPLDQLQRLRDHGVTPDYVRDMTKLGYSLPPDELVRLRDHGITVDYTTDIAGLGYAKLPADSLVRLRDHGITPDYVRDLKALGYDRVALDDLVSLRDHGLTADRIKSVNNRAGTRLPIELLLSGMR